MLSLFTESTTYFESSWAIIIKKYSPKAKWILLNNPLDFVSGTIQQCSLPRRRKNCEILFQNIVCFFIHLSMLLSVILFEYLLSPPQLSSYITPPHKREKLRGNGASLTSSAHECCILRVLVGSLDPDYKLIYRSLTLYGKCMRQLSLRLI